MRITGRGNPAIRATHDKTLEFTPDTEITARATCVVATGTTVEPAHALAGRVRITITVGDHRPAVLHARANPEWDPTGPAVIRRSPVRLPGTLATHADTAAAQLPREFAATLRDPEVLVVADVEPMPDAEPVLVLFAATTVTPALEAELDAADVVVAQDAGARTLTRRADPPPATIDGRVLVVATDDLPGATIAPPHVRVETVGLPPRLAVAAACPSRAPVAFVTGLADLADAPATYRVVVAVEARDLPALLATARRVRGTDTVTVGQRHTPPWRHAIGEPVDLPARATIYCCLHPAGSPDGSTLDPRVHAAVTALLADGVPTRAAARALAELTGWPRRRAYDAVIDIGRASR